MHSNGQHQCHNCKYGQGGADGAAGPFIILHAGVFPHQNGAAQGQAGYHAGDDLGYLGSGGHCGHTLRRTVPPDDHKIHGSIKGLYDIGNQEWNGEGQQYVKYVAFGQQIVVFHDESLLNITFVKNKNKPSSYWRVNKKRLFNLKIFIPLRNIYSFMHFKYGICISVTYRDVSLVKPASISVISTESPQQAYSIRSIYSKSCI